MKQTRRGAVVFHVLLSGLIILFLSNVAKAYEFSISLDPASAVGNYHGKLNLSFDHNDWSPWAEVPLGWWSFAGSAANEGYAVSGGSNEFVTVSLAVISEAPGELYVYGGIILSQGMQSILVVGGGPGGTFRPGKPLVPNSTWSEMNEKGYQPWLHNGDIGLISYDIGFYMDMPWDGAFAAWEGNWWVNWARVPEPATIFLFGLGVIGLCGFRQKKRDLKNSIHSRF
jgi:hypothetical protein